MVNYRKTTHCIISIYTNTVQILNKPGPNDIDRGF